MDQDYQTINIMRALGNIYKTVSKFRGLTGESVNTNLSVSERLLLGSLYEMRLLGGLRGSS